MPSQRLSRDWRHPREIDTPERDAIWVRHMHEHPTLMHIRTQRDGQARMVSDFLSQSRYQRLGLYHELFRDLQVEDILTVAAMRVLTCIRSRWWSVVGVSLLGRMVRSLDMQLTWK